MFRFFWINVFQQFLRYAISLSSPCKDDRPHSREITKENMVQTGLFANLKHVQITALPIQLLSRKALINFGFFASIYSNGSLYMPNQVLFRQIGLIPEKKQKKDIIQTGLSANLENIQITALLVQLLSGKAPRQVSIFFN